VTEQKPTQQELAELSAAVEGFVTSIREAMTELAAAFSAAAQEWSALAAAHMPPGQQPGVFLHGRRIGDVSEAATPRGSVLSVSITDQTIAGFVAEKTVPGFSVEEVPGAPGPSDS